VAVDNDRYTIDGKYRQIMLSARELNSQSLPSRTWINEHLTFTHGYGLTLGPVNQVTQEGLPVLYVGDLPLVSTVDLEVKEPSLYFGELSNDYVFVRTGAREFHYPRGEDNVTTTYTGRGGVPVNSIWRKAALAMRFRAADLLQQRHHQRQPRPVPSPDQRACADDRAVPVVRSRSVPRAHGRAAGVASGRLHPHGSVSVLDAYSGQRELHPQLREDCNRRVRRDDDLLPGRSEGSDCRHLRAHLPRAVPADERHAGGSPQPRALPGDPLLDPDGDVHDVSHDQSGGVLQQGRPVGRAGHRRQRSAAGTHGALLHDHEAAG
jgi:hypothetical protein